MIFNSIAIASDHRGYLLKARFVEYFKAHKYEFIDFGTNCDTVSVDYPDYAQKVAEYVIEHERSCGVLICYSGVGMSISANRVPGIRAVLCYSTEVAKLSREHNDTNIICFGANFVNEEAAIEMFTLFAHTQFDSRHIHRIRKLDVK